MENSTQDLVEKMIHEDPSPEEQAALPQEVKDRTLEYFKGLVDEAVREVSAGRIVDGPSAMKRLRAEIEAVKNVGS